MAPKKKKNPSFDAMIKLFIKNYNIPTKKDVPSRKDIDKLNARLDRLEQMILKVSKSGHGKIRAGKAGGLRGKNSMTASDMVLNIVEKSSEKGVGFAEIRDKTGLDDKKLRNIIFRLNHTGKIRRKSRGIYIVAGSV
ncbi:MAG: hypothetical protein GY749_32880 [Desulfobacteraceae bacterium]|nr:hypothetical protein [Desulfobacteraceae bacterium]